MIELELIEFPFDIGQSRGGINQVCSNHAQCMKLPFYGLGRQWANQAKFKGAVC